MFDLSMVLMNQIVTIYSTLHRFHGKIAKKKSGKKIFFAHFLSICKPQFDFVIKRMQKLVEAHTVKPYKKSLESCTFDESQSNNDRIFKYFKTFSFRKKIVRNI